MKNLRYDQLFTDQPVDQKGDVPLYPGCGYVLDGRLVRLLRVEADAVVVEDPVTNQALNVKISQLSIPPGQKRQSQWTNKVSRHEFKRAENLRAKIQEALAIPWEKRTDELIQTLAHGFEIKPRRFRGLMAAWMANPDLMTLIRQPRGPKCESKRCSKDVEAVLDDVVTWARNKKEAITLEACREEFKKLAKPRIKKLNKEIKAPGDKVFRNRLSRSGILLNQRRRLGPSKAKELERPHIGTYEVDGVLTRIEIDHTRVDLMVYDDEKGVHIGRPWLTLVIECGTRIVMGWYVSFDYPSIESVAQALICAVTPKNERLKELGIGQLEIPYWGRPKLVVTDNAREFKSEVVRRACKANNIDIEFRPLGKKYFGGRIERVIGTIMGKCHLLCGTTFNSPRHRDNYDSEAKATLSLREFEGWLVAQICAYHHTPHSKLGRTPHQEWVHRLTTKNGEYIPPAHIVDVEAFSFHFLHRMQKTLQQRGYKWDTRWYRNEVLFNLFTVGKAQWVYVDYSKPNVLFVRDEKQVIHRIPTNEPDSLSYSARVARRRALRRQGRSPESVAKRDDSLKAASTIYEGAKRKKRQRRRGANPAANPKHRPDAPTASEELSEEQFRIPFIRY